MQRRGNNGAKFYNLNEFCGCVKFCDGTGASGGGGSGGGDSGPWGSRRRQSGRTSTRRARIRGQGSTFTSGTTTSRLKSTIYNCASGDHDRSGVGSFQEYVNTYTPTASNPNLLPQVYYVRDGVRLRRLRRNGCMPAGTQYEYHNALDVLLNYSALYGNYLNADYELPLFGPADYPNSLSFSLARRADGRWVGRQLRSAARRRPQPQRASCRSARHAAQGSTKTAAAKQSFMGQQMFKDPALPVDKLPSPDDKRFIRQLHREWTSGNFARVQLPADYFMTMLLYDPVRDAFTRPNAARFLRCAAARSTWDDGARRRRTA